MLTKVAHGVRLLRVGVTVRILLREFVHGCNGGQSQTLLRQCIVHLLKARDALSERLDDFLAPYRAVVKAHVREAAIEGVRRREASTVTLLLLAENEAAFGRA